MKKFTILLAVVLFVAMLSGISTAKTLYVYAQSQVSNADSTPASGTAISSNLKLQLYDNQCVELRFSVEAAVSGAGDLQIAFWPTIDGQPVFPTANGAGVVYWDASTASYYDLAAFNWFVCGLNTGVHNVSIYYNPSSAGDTAFLRATSLTIQVKKGKLVP